MGRNHRVAAITVGIFVAGILGASVGTSVARDDARNVMLTLRVATTGVTILKVQPRDAKLWRNDPEKPSQIRWWMVNSTQYSELYFEIRHDPSRTSNGEDYFGDIDIECGETEITVAPSPIPDTANAEWPYVVTVYGCVDGQKAQKLEDINPIVVWKD